MTRPLWNLEEITDDDLPVEELTDLWADKPCEFTLDDFSGEIEKCRRKGLDPFKVC